MKIDRAILLLVLSLFVIVSGCNYDDDGPLLPDDTGDYAYPIPTITSPENYSSFSSGDDIELVGQAIAGDSTIIPGSDLTWRSTRDGELGSGNSLTVDLSPGNHFIVLTAADSNDSTASVSISIIVDDDTPTLSVEIISPSAGSYSVGASLILTALAQDGEGNTLSDSALVWSSSIDAVIDTGNNITYVPSEGTHLITVIATDSLGNTATDNVSIVISTGGSGDEPDVTISSPANGAEFLPGDTILFTGLAVDFRDEIVPDSLLTWESDIDGELGKGYSVEGVLTTGTHRITLTAVDIFGNTGVGMIVIVIGEPSYPVALIIDPREGESFSESEPIALHGLTTSELPIISYQWTSSINGVIGTRQIDESMLSIGNHTIVFSVTNSSGLTGRDTVHIRVGEDHSPVVTIAEPDDSAHFDEGEIITFIGSAYDLDDGPLTGTSLYWSSDRDRFLGYGQTFDFELSPGLHLIKLMAIDSDFNDGMDSIWVFVEGLDGPNVVILTPLPHTQFPELGLITFGGYAIDDEDGSLPSERLSWWSSIDGNIGVGVPLMRALTAGEHIIVLTATDYDGMTGTDTVQITVLNYPEPLILTPANGSRFRDDDIIIAKGMAYDVEDGAIPGTSLSWLIADTLIGTGDSIAFMLPAGVHRINLTAVDSDDMEATVSVQVRVDASTPPYIEIIAPEDGHAVSEDVPIVFRCIANDVEDGDLTGTDIEWTSDIELPPTIGYGTYFTTGLSSGTHTITATATDSDGLSTSASINVLIY